MQESISNPVRVAMQLLGESRNSIKDVQVITQSGFDVVNETVDDWYKNAAKNPSLVESICIVIK
jgi:hypothetical protein